MEGTDNPISPIERCANEILSEIHYFLTLQPPHRTKRDVLALRLTSHRLNSFFTRYAITIVKFSWSVEENDTGLSIRRTQVQGQPMVAPAPSIFLPIITRVSIHFFNMNECRKELQTPQTAQKLVNQLQAFWDEIGRYASLKRLEVNWVDYRAKPGLKRSIFHAVAGKLLQTELHLATPMPESFQSSLGLQNYEVHARHNGGHPEGFGPDQLKLSLLGDIVLRNPNIRSIMLSGSSPYTVCTWEELFPLKFEKLAVEKIILSGYLRRIPSFSLPYISAFPKLPNLKELIMYTGTLNHTSEKNLDPLWILLKNSGAELSRLPLRYGLSDTLAD
ncbi:hypothetical protein AX16_010036 [Volvariella volvacea WC 439]|nr:hypothetical protein AX16_010036 [Volvariella volvacea WC 439]